MHPDKTLDPRWTGEETAIIASSSDQLARRGGILFRKSTSDLLFWSELTQNLFKALEDMSATKACETDAVKSELGNNENKKKLKEEEQAREEARLRERRRDLQNIREKKEWYDNHAAKLATGAGVAEGDFAGTDQLVVKVRPKSNAALYYASVDVEYRCIRALKRTSSG
ncbi:hypothetical protein B0J15DRAFT_472863 [Fusarium solani]|uniref:Uncharacterized protein n=1 Tax=Fusarium solani TaxID=169388 RepID=A0A9P9G081_FUSSL|nr:uncharacterized protein B0J15DRAFT_472863 [Fusarium solani]KAH7230860.1 hypothetical protein B0J15DRAFT_472863 [Fusarium solani]